MRKLIFTVGTAFLWGVLIHPLLAQPGGSGSKQGGQSGATAQGGGGQGGGGQAGAGQSGQAGQAGQSGQAGQAGQGQPATAGQPASAGKPSGSPATPPTQGTATANQNQGAQAGANVRTGQQQQQQQQQQNLKDAKDRQMQGQQQVDNAQRDRQRGDRNQFDNNADRSGQFGVNNRTGSQQAFKFDDKPEFRDSLKKRDFPLHDWRIVLSSGRHWYWTPNQTWVYYDNGSWVDFQPGIAIGGNVVLFPPNYPRDEWRIVNHSGRRWYYAPDNVWLYYDNGNWVTFQQNAPSGAVVVYPPGYPQDEWRVVTHSGRRWYWTPDGAWLLFEGNRWNPFRGDRVGLRQRVGFRGTEDQQMDRPQLDPPGNVKKEGDADRNQTFRDQQPGNQQQSGNTQARQPGGAGAGASQQQGQQAGQGGNVMSPPTPPTPKGSDKNATPAGQTGGGAQPGNTSDKDR